ncbi:hypothetical protein BOSE62_71356 [Bosea sp. 62]|nr:hypothetical protein BOSE46_80366 [Bosea sp. 46]CAD5298561.1 hypothetical protein BOSE7B_60401 [Bosea sp. 7B]VXC90518.1 hypothetical protein BOSE62_71356 [Bosea sp. 62]
MIVRFHGSTRRGIVATPLSGGHWGWPQLFRRRGRDVSGLTITALPVLAKLPLDMPVAYAATGERVIGATESGNSFSDSFCCSTIRNRRQARVQLASMRVCARSK